MSDIMTAAGPTSRRAKAGLIAFGRAKFICKVRSMSASGAVLEIASSLKIPDQFVLKVATEERQRRTAVVWRETTRIGVAFY